MLRRRGRRPPSPTIPHTLVISGETSTMNIVTEARLGANQETLARRWFQTWRRPNGSSRRSTPCPGSSPSRPSPTSGRRPNRIPSPGSSTAPSRRWPRSGPARPARGGRLVTINLTDGKGRNRENIIGIRALWQEDDHGDERELPVEPHQIVETSPGKFHRYLLVVGMPLDDFEPAQQVMVDHFGSDPSAKDRARVMRLPGFWHMKDPSQPHPVRLIHESGALPWAWEDLRMRLPPVLPRAAIAPALETAGEWNGNVPVKSKWPSNRAEIESALSVLDPDMDYDPWIRVGMALHQGADGDEDAQDLWDSWSSGGSKYIPDDCSDKWHGFRNKGVNGTTLLSLFSMAHKAGWSGWKEPTALEKLTGAAKGLTKTSTDQEIKAVLKGIGRVEGFDRTGSTTPSRPIPVLPWPLSASGSEPPPMVMMLTSSRWPRRSAMLWVGEHHRPGVWGVALSGGTRHLVRTGTPR